MARDAGQEPGIAAGVNRQAQIARPDAGPLIKHQREGLHAKLGRVDAKHQVMHRRVTNDCQLDHVLAVDLRLTRQRSDQIGQRPLHRGCQFRRRALILLQIRDPAHQVFTKPDLRVHHAGRGQHLAGIEGAEVACDGGSAHIDRDPVDPVLEPGPDSDRLAALPHGDGRLELAPIGLARSQRGRETREASDVPRKPLQAPIIGERGDDPLKIRPLILHAGLRQLHVMKGYHRIDLKVPDLIRPLTHDLAVDLTFLGDVDHHVP